MHHKMRLSLLIAALALLVAGCSAGGTMGPMHPTTGNGAAMSHGSGGGGGGGY